MQSYHYNPLKLIKCYWTFLDWCQLLSSLWIFASFTSLFHLFCPLVCSSIVPFSSSILKLKFTFLPLSYPVLTCRFLLMLMYMEFLICELPMDLPRPSDYFLFNISILSGDRSSILLFWTVDPTSTSFGIPNEFCDASLSYKWFCFWC